MSTPHTPGPWDYGARLSASENHHGFYVRADGWVLAFVQPGDQDGALGEANARLIAAAPAPVAVQACRLEDRAMLATPAGAELVTKVAAALADEPATLKLGVICDRLGFTVSGAFLGDTLHIKPAKVDDRAALFTESQFRAICAQLVSHVGAMAELYAAQEVTA